MSITEDHKKQVDFAAKYFDTPSCFIAMEGATFALTTEGAKGLKIGVLRGTSLQYFDEKHFPEADLRLYDTQEDAFADLVAGRLDMQLNTTERLRGAIEATPTEKLRPQRPAACHRAPGCNL